MRKLVLLVAVSFGATAARADNGFFYVGAGVVRDSLHNIAPNGFSLGNIDSTSGKALVGLRPVSSFAVEVEYLNLGSQVFRPNIEANGNVSYHAFAAYALGFLPVPLPYLDVFGKAGLARWSSSGGAVVFANPPSYSFSDSGTVFGWGVGTQVHVGSIGARLEYEGFRIPNTNGANVISLTAFLNLY